MNRPPQPIALAHLFAACTVVIWSFSYIHMIWLAESLNAVQIVIARNLSAIPIVLVLWLWRRPKLRMITRRQWVTITAIALASGPAYHLPLAWGADEGRANASLIGLIIATVPVHVGWLGWVFLRERLSWQRLAGLALGVGGVGVVLVGRFVRDGNGEGDAFFTLSHLEGALAVVVAAIIAAGNNVLTRGARNMMPSLDLACVGCTISIVLALAAAPFFEMEALVDVTPIGLWSAFYLGFFAIGIAYITWYSALQGRLPAVSVAMYLFVPTILSALWAWLWQDNTIGPPFFIGAAMVLAGLLLGVLRNPRQAIDSKRMRS